MGIQLDTFCCGGSPDSCSDDEIVYHHQHYYYPPASVRVMSRTYTFGDKSVTAECVKQGTNEIGGFPLYEFSVPDLDNVTVSGSALLTLRDNIIDKDIAIIEVNVTQLYAEAPSILVVSDDNLRIDMQKMCDAWHRVLFDQHGYIRYLDADELLPQDNTMLNVCMEVRLLGDDVAIRNVSLYHRLLHNIVGFVE